MQYNNYHVHGYPNYIFLQLSCQLTSHNVIWNKCIQQTSETYLIFAVNSLLQQK